MATTMRDPLTMLVSCSLELTSTGAFDMLSGLSGLLVACRLEAGQIKGRRMILDDGLKATALPLDARYRIAITGSAS